MFTDQERRDIYVLAQQAWRDKLLSTQQLHALQFWSQGIGYKRIGAALGISRDSARGRVDRALTVMKRLAEQEAA